MERQIFEKLVEWKKSSTRKPLILQGVRQCGKTYIVREFGQREYSEFLEINFEKEASARNIFNDGFEVKSLLTKLELYFNKKIDINNTLLFFDEIQECPNAITSLKYFCEDLGDLNIIAAGSLLGISLARNFSYPVGKTDMLTLYPLSFSEFVLARDKKVLSEYINSYDGKNINEVAFNELEKLYKEYLFVGGMPAAVSSWIENRDYDKVDVILDAIIHDYESDFAKHIASADIPKVCAIWESIPNQLGNENKKFKYKDVAQRARTSTYENAVEWLKNAGLIYKVNRIKSPGIPLSSFAEDSSFKIYLCDVGLLRKRANISARVIFNNADSNNDYTYIEETYKYFKGSLTENFVLCELIKNIGMDNYYWKSDNSAEVDFVKYINDYNIPIEVKAGKNLKAKSLKVYNDTYSPKYSVKTSLDIDRIKQNEKNNSIIYIPLYLIGKIKNLIN